MAGWLDGRMADRWVADVLGGWVAEWLDGMMGGCVARWHDGWLCVNVRLVGWSMNISDWEATVTIIQSSLHYHTV